jgi:hypothetical protein
MEEWHLHIAISQALSDSREAPWYGAWNIVMRDMIFNPRKFCREPFMTITYPQFPVSKGIDTDDAGDDDDEDEESDIDGGKGGGDNDVQMSQSPPTSRGVAPSPEIFRGSPSVLPPTPPKDSFPLMDSSPPPPPKKRTTRIPDFLQMLYRLSRNNDGTTRFPAKYSERIMLIVEIKKLDEQPTLAHFAAIRRQTDHQARHALHASPTTDTLGVILAMGRYWTYGEYRRTDLRPSPSLSEKKDPTYRVTERTPIAFMKGLPSFEMHLGHDVCLCLETERSDQGLRIVQKRLHALNLPAVSAKSRFPFVSNMLNLFFARAVTECIHDY